MHLPSALTSGVIQVAKQVRWDLRLRYDSTVDRRYSISTVPEGELPRAAERARFEDAHVNGPVSYLLLRSYIDWRKLSPADVFYDIGCGCGRVLCVAARHRLAKCVGIELSAEFAAKARENAAALRSRVSPVEVRVGDAAEMNYDDGTFFYFGDPFGPETMSVVLKRIGASVAARPRPIRCIFLLPKDSRSEAVCGAIASSPWLRWAGEKSHAWSHLRAEYWATNR